MCHSCWVPVPVAWGALWIIVGLPTCASADCTHSRPSPPRRPPVAAPDPSSLPAFFTNGGGGDFDDDDALIGGLDDLTFGTGAASGGDANAGLPAFFTSGGDDGGLGGLDDGLDGGLDDGLGDARAGGGSGGGSGFLLTPAGLTGRPTSGSAPAPAPAPAPVAAPAEDDWDRSRAEFARMQQEFLQQHGGTGGGAGGDDYSGFNAQTMLDDAHLSSVFSLALDDDDDDGTCAVSCQHTGVGSRGARLRTPSAAVVVVMGTPTTAHASHRTP